MSLQQALPCSWNPLSREVYLINFVSILSDYNELDDSKEGIMLYESVREDFTKHGFDSEAITESFKLAKCMLISEKLLKLAQMPSPSETILQNAKNLLANIANKDKILSKLTEDMAIN